MIIMKRNEQILLLFTILAFTTACSHKTLTPDEQISIAVQQTLAAIPTQTPVPFPTPYPSPTPFSLTGLFCEYRFCIGHPPEMSFLDGMALRDPLNPSSYAQGLLAAYQGNLYIQFEWQSAPGISDPQFMLDTILHDEVDSRTGSLQIKLIREMNVIYTSIETKAHLETPFGGAAAWTCGDRAFAWKIYTPQAESAEALFNDAIRRFTCGT